jgi:hypothetical protein
MGMGFEFMDGKILLIISIMCLHDDLVYYIIDNNFIYICNADILNLFRFLFLKDNLLLLSDIIKWLLLDLICGVSYVYIKQKPLKKK